MTRKFDTFDDYRRHLRNKYGLGEGVDYKPWLTVRDVKPKNASRGMVFGLKTGREHHLLSSIETQLFYLLEYRDDVIDIREQFPLIPLEISQKIAKTIGVEHPKVPKTGIPNIMTTDFLVTIENGEEVSYIAFCVKPAEKLQNLRILEKIEIERVWWELLGVAFVVFTGTEHTKAQSRNISWATAPLRSGTKYELEGYLDHAVSLLSAGKYLKSDICDSFMEAFDLESSDALNLLRILIAKKLISVDMSGFIDESVSISIQNVATLARSTSYEY